jgi:hypothetical protein
MAEELPDGARVVSSPRRFDAVIRLAARRTSYPVEVIKECRNADFILAARKVDAEPRAQLSCGVPFHLLDSSPRISLTGDGWNLYAAERLQSTRTPVSGPGKAQ